METEPLEKAARRENIAQLKQLATISASELQNTHFEPINYIVPSYVPEGLSIFAGAPKLGKSWMCLDFACAVAEAGQALNSEECEQGDVLYLALEDNQRRLQDRMNKLHGPDNEWPSRLSFALECPKLDDGGTEYIENWIASVERPRLIIIDTLQAVRGRRDSRDSTYEGDYKAMEALKGIVSERSDLALMVVHHTRKQDADDPLDVVSGSQGLNGAADNTIVLQRDNNGTTLYARGRDIEEVNHAVRFSDFQWHVEGNADQVRQSDQRRQIMDALTSLGEAGPKEIADATGVDNGTVRQLLRKMVKSGQAERAGYGRYILARCNETNDML